MRASRHLTLLFALLLVPSTVACGGDDDDNPADGDSDDGAGDAGSDSGDDADDTDDDADDDDGSDDGSSGDAGDGESFACKHLDIVFAVDPSGSMDQEMTAMGSDIFPAFADTLLNISEGLEDYRAATLDACPDPASFNTSGEGPTNEPGDDVACNFAGGAAWIEATPESDPTAVTAEFQCVGTIDRVQVLDMEGEPTGDITAGACAGNNDDEQPTTAVITALTPPFSMNENAGFLREDAVLVVIAMTDEDEQPTPNATAQELYDQLVAVKGDVKDMVFLGIGGGVPDGCEGEGNGGIYGTAQPATKLSAVTDLFKAQERGVYWDLCEGQLQDGLAEALAVIEQACDEFGGVD